MTDRFSIELRRHFVETADEVAPAGQLERIQRLVGAVPQQAPWHVRLRWLVSPWAPYANAGARTAILAAAALLLLAATIGVVALGGGGPGTRSTPFEGSWTAVDPGDGSALTLIVGPGQTPAVHFEDAMAVNCQLNGDSSVLFLADGTGEVQGGTLRVQFPSGGCVSWIVPAFDVIFQHDAVTDTMLNNAGETWSRDETPRPLPSPRSGSLPSADAGQRTRTPFEGSWTSIDPVDGSRQTLVVGPGQTPAVHFEDAMAFHCRESGDSSVLFLADGAGEVEGRQMVVSFPSGGCVSWQVEAFAPRYQHDVTNDTLRQDDGAIWYRDEAQASAP